MLLLLPPSSMYLQNKNACYFYLPNADFKSLPKRGPPHVNKIAILMPSRIILNAPTSFPSPATYFRQSISHYAIFFASNNSTLFTAYLYRKVELSLPVNLNSG
jgi:hypothetical protein